MGGLSTAANIPRRKSARNAQFFTKEFLTQHFYQNIWFVSINLITLHADTRNGKRRPKRKPRNVSTRTDNNGNGMRVNSLFDKLFNC